MSIAPAPRRRIPVTFGVSRSISARNCSCLGLPANGMPTPRTALIRPSRPETEMGRPFSHAPEPSSAQNVSLRRGTWVTPAMTFPCRARATFTANRGRPNRKFTVPSSGSTIHKCSSSRPETMPPSSPRKP